MKDEDSQLWKKHSIEDIFKIVAKDLRGDALKAKVKELLGVK